MNLLDIAPRRMAGLLLLLMLGLMIGNSWHKTLTYDEPFNLKYGSRLLSEGPMAPMEGQRMPVLALHALGCLPYQCEIELLQSSNRLRVAVRLPSMLFTLAAGWLIFLWILRLYGAKPALAGLMLYVFNPTFIAHGKQLTSDMPTLFFAIATVYFFWRFLTTGRYWRFIAAAVMLAGGILSKFSALLLLPALALIFIVHSVASKKKIHFGKAAGSAVIAGFIVWFLINAAYLFAGTFTKASNYPWQSKKYVWMKNASMPLPLPRIFMEGLDYTSYLEENPNIGRGNNYIFQKRHRKGRWYAFMVMILLKTPLAFFLILLLAAFRKGRKPEEIYGLLLLPFGVWLAAFSAANAQLGVRYVMPCLAFPLIFAARAYMNPSKIQKAVLAALTGWYIVSSLSYFPHQLSYFNEIIGPRVNAWKWLSDSNLEWEDKKYYIDKFLAEYPGKNIQVRPVDIQPGWMLIAANDLTGVLEEHRYGWLRDRFQPRQHVTYSHFLFYVSPEEYAKIPPEEFARR